MICKGQGNGCQGVDCPICRGAGLVSPITWQEYTDRCLTTAKFKPLYYLDKHDYNMVLSPVSFVYPALKLTGEAGELCSAVSDWCCHSTKEHELAVLKEMGDVCRYIATLAHVRELDFKPEINDRKFEDDAMETATTLLRTASVVSELLGKVIRDRNGQPNDNDKKRIKDELLLMIACLRNLVWVGEGKSFEDILLMNLQKLASRKERNVIHGSGDNR